MLLRVYLRSDKRLNDKQPPKTKNTEPICTWQKKTFENLGASDFRTEQSHHPATGTVSEMEHRKTVFKGLGLTCQYRADTDPPVAEAQP